MAANRALPGGSVVANGQHINRPAFAKAGRARCCNSPKTSRGGAECRPEYRQARGSPAGDGFSSSDTRICGRRHCGQARKKRRRPRRKRQHARRHVDEGGPARIGAVALDRSWHHADEACSLRS